MTKWRLLMARYGLWRYSGFRKLLILATPARFERSTFPLGGDFVARSISNLRSAWDQRGSIATRSHDAGDYCPIREPKRQGWQMSTFPNNPCYVIKEFSRQNRQKLALG